MIYLRRSLKKQIGVAFSNTIWDNPDGNRVLIEEELEYCLKYLYEDIKALKERGLRVVIPLGNAAKQALIKESSRGISQDHGKFFSVNNPVFGSIIMMPTYHPSYIIRSVPIFKETEFSELDRTVIEDIRAAYQMDSESAKKISEIENEFLF